MLSVRFHRRAVAASLFAALTLALTLAAPAAGQLPEPSATPVPALPDSGDAFVLEIESICCSSPARVVDSSVTVVDGVIRVETATDCGPLAAVTGYEYTVVVPPLPPGDYPVEVYSQGECNAGEQTLEITDALTVEPRGALSENRCRPGVEPAATLLFPYFEVDIESAQGITTLLAITNALAEPVLANVVVWSDLAIPVGSFRVYLSGYDVQTLNLRDVLAGNLPATGPGSGITAPPGCDPEDVAGDFDADLAAQALRSRVVDGQCWSLEGHPDRAVGYVTVDVVDACSDLVPGDAGYFAPGGSGVASNTNALLGDLILAETGESFAQGTPAVHLVADESAFEPGDPTFYGRYVGLDASDARMPLGRIHAARYLENAGFDGGTELLVWRDVIFPATGPVSCPPTFEQVDWLPVETTVDVFDEEENRVQLRTGAELLPLSAAARRIPASDLSPFGSGWMRFDTHGQATIVPVMRALGRFSVGMPSGQLDDACAALE